MQRFPRYRERGFGLLFSAFAAAMAISAAAEMFPLDLGDGPLWSKVIVVVFMTCWYGLLLIFFLYGLSWAQTIEINDLEIRVCLGNFVVRRIPLENVKTVGISVVYANKGSHIVNWMLVLSEKDRHELEEKGQKYLKRRSVRYWMSKASVSSEGAYASARAFLFQSRKGELLRTEWTEETEAILRQRLPFATFLL